MTLETIINGVEDDLDLLLKSQNISDMILKIEKLVKSCHGIEKSSGELLSKTAVISIAGEIMDILTSEIQDKILVEKIAERIGEMINRYEEP